MDYRKKQTFKVITFPEGNEEEDRGLKNVCCDPFLVLGDVSDDISYKNDIELAYIKASELSDIVTFSIEKCGTVGALTQLGTVAVFPEDDLGRGFMYDWRQYLNTFGAGSYVINVAFTISGVTDGFVWGEFELRPYSIENASRTIRVKSTFNSKYQKINLDFTNSNCETTLRMNGYFGDPEPNTQVNQLITKGFVSEKTTRKDDDKFQLNTNPLSICFTRKLRFQLLVQDGCFISDHNRYNHDYNLFDISVVLDESSEIGYRQLDRGADIKAIFTPRKKDDNSYYNRP